MTGGAGFSRSRKRPRRARGITWPKALLAGLIVTAAIVGAVIGVSSYRLARTYRQYPLRYKTMIVDAAKTYGLEPWHVAAVVRCESSFNATAVSNVGARGLMQIMPDTGAWLAHKLGEDDSYTDDGLFDPQTNLRYGCWYLGWLMDRFSGDRVLATAAYHAGQGQVDSWLQNPDVSADGATIAVEKIPFDSTRRYVQRILTSCEKYKELYDFETDEGA